VRREDGSIVSPVILRGAGRAGCYQKIGVPVLVAMTHKKGGPEGPPGKTIKRGSYSYLTFAFSAWTTVIEVMSTISSTVAWKLRMFAGLSSPISTGPTAMAPASRWINL